MFQSICQEWPLDNLQALDNFLAGIERRAYHMAVVATGNREDALDIVQDTMLKHVQLYSKKSEPEWQPLFYRILHSRINDWYRRTKVRNRWRIWLQDRPAGDSGNEFREDGLANKADFRQVEIPDELVARDDYETVMKAVELLPLRQKQALLLRAWQGLSVGETAFVMGCSEGSVKTHYFRATHALREVLEEQG
jgi:RNA polymerase sigma-70 factor (ECF subfamily)